MKFIVPFILSSLSLPVSEPNQKLVDEQLKIAAEASLTTNHGVLIFSQIFDLSVGTLVKIYRPDGFCYHGKITRIEKNPEQYKVFGVINNVQETGFGFAITREGLVAGAVLEKAKKKLYTLAYNEEISGFILMPASFPEET